MASPYTNSILISNLDGETLLGPYDQNDVGTQGYVPIQATHILKDGETLQSIAHRYYGDSGLWYRIVAFNNIIDPFSIQPYTKLFIPV